MNGRRIFERQKDIATKILRKIKYKNVFKILLIVKPLLSKCVQYKVKIRPIWYLTPHSRKCML